MFILKPRIVFQVIDLHQYDCLVLRAGLNDGRGDGNERDITVYVRAALLQIKIFAMHDLQVNSHKVGVVTQALALAPCIAAATAAAAPQNAP